MEIETSFNEHVLVCNNTLKLLKDDIYSVGLLMARTLRNGGTIYWCGNGGSASDSQHLAAELVGRFSNARKPLKSIALNTDTSVLTCIANDFSYNDIFSRQVSAFLDENDLLVCISTSGLSQNILNACQEASKKNAKIVALVGKDGGKLSKFADYSLFIPSHSTARIQEVHILIGHIFCSIIEKELQLV